LNDYASAGKTAVVTGARHGLRKAMAQALAQAGSEQAVGLE
jgi:NAD(P)-dependent dehydrogenase (short-subunit alcohol dehydrogenase family)